MNRVPFHSGLRFKAASSLLLFGLLLSLVLVFIVRGAVLRQFERSEQGQAETDFTRAEAFMEFRLGMLKALARDYGFWSETYRHAEGRNPGFAEENLGPEQLDSLRLDLLALVDGEGRLAAWSLRPGARKVSAAELEASLQAALRHGPGPEAEEGPAGIWNLSDGPVLLAAARILRSDRTGPPRGYFVVARRLHGAFEASLNEVTQSTLRLAGPGEGNAAVVHRVDLESLTMHSARGLADLAGRPVAVLELTRQMEQYAMGRRIVDSLGVATVVLTLSGAAFLLLLLDVLVLSRVAQLHQAAERVSSGAERYLPLDRAPHDEIEALGRMMRQAFARLGAEERKARASEAKYRAVVEQCPEGIFLAEEKDWLLLEANAALARMLGVETDKLQGVLFDHIPGAMTPPLAEVKQAFASGGHVVFRVARPEQSALKFELVRIHTAGRALVCGLAEDLGGQERLQEQISRAEVAETVGQLAGGVAHDFNNLLTVIMGAAELVEQDPGLGGQSREGLRAILQAARSASDLTRKLLLYGRRGPLQMKQVDLGAVLLDLQPMLVRVIPENITLEVRAERGRLPVQADARALEQAVINVVLNARDAMPRGGRLSVAAEAEGLRAVLSVADTGEGMGEEVRRRIFEPFYTTKPPGKGSGLGLSTVQGILRQHGGEVEVESQLGRGSKFRLVLPLAETAASPPAERERKAQDTRCGGLILLVEDEAAIRQVLGLFLRKAGYEVREAASGAEALALARSLERAPFALVSDVVKPGHLSGFDVASDLSVLFPGLKVVLMSGYNPEMLESGGSWQRQSHPDRYRFLNKPFNTQQLLDELASLHGEVGRTG